MTTTTKETIKRALADKAGAHMGDIVWPEISDVDNQNYVRTDIADKLANAGLPRDLINDALSAQAALGRARNEVNADHDGYTVATARKRDTAFHVFRTKGDGTSAVKVTCHVLSIDSNGSLLVVDTPNATKESIEIVRAVKDRFAHHNAYATHRDVAKMVVKAMRWMGATRIRRSGSLFWVGDSKAGQLRAFAEVVETLGHCELVAMPVYETKESKAQAGRAVKTGLAEEISDVATKLIALRASSNDTRVSTVERKLAEIDEIELRVESLANILDKRADELRAQVSGAKNSAAQLLAEVQAGKKGGSKPKKAEKKAEAKAPEPAPKAAIDDIEFD